MKTFIKILFLSLTMLTFGKVAKAETIENKQEEKPIHIYKSVTSTDIMYIIDKNGEFQYSWKFNKKNLDTEDVNINLKLNFTSPSKASIDKLIGNSDLKRQYLSFEYHGILPTNALIKVKVDNSFKDGDHLYLYYYNKDNLEYIKKDLIVKNGFVEFEISHCSDYLLTSSIIKTASDNPQSMGFIIVIMMVIVVGLVAVTLFQNKNK